MKTEEIFESLTDLQVEQSHDGYYYKISDALKIITLGSLCGLKNV